MQQGRWVSYIYRYRNNVRCENAGFVKVQRINCRGRDEARIQIGIKLFKQRACKCKVFLLYNGNKACLLTELNVRALERDAIIKRVEVPWDRPANSAITFSAYDGLVFICDDGEFMAGLWNERLWQKEPLRPDAIELVEGVLQATAEVACEDSEQEIQTECSEPKDGEVDNYLQMSRKKGEDAVHNLECGEDIRGRQLEEKYGIENSGNEKYVYGQSVSESNEKNKDACVEMMNTYPKLPLFADSQFVECVKIVPQDIGKLAMGNWKLGVNSFLSHGYYHYRYLMLGKVKFDKGECYVIGVPGVFTNKEKYLANMFGFNVFIPAKKTKIMTGNFGYWISEVIRE